MKKLKEKLNAKLSKNGGFTLVEMLIVVAIIAVLVAISIPIFTSQLEKAREATDAANLRAAYAEIMADAITNNGTTTLTKEVTVNQTVAGWSTDLGITFAANFNVDPTTDTANTKWEVAAVTDANGLVTGVKATIS